MYLDCYVATAVYPLFLFLFFRAQHLNKECNATDTCIPTFSRRALEETWKP